MIAKGIRPRNSGCLQDQWLDSCLSVLLLKMATMTALTWWAEERTPSINSREDPGVILAQGQLLASKGPASRCEHPAGPPLEGGSSMSWCMGSCVWILKGTK